MTVRSEVLLVELPATLSAVNGAGPIRLPASHCLTSVRLCGGQHLPYHLQLFLRVRRSSSASQDSDVTDITCFRVGVDPSSPDTQGC